MIHHRFQRVALAAAGAIALSALSIAAAIGPASAVETDRTIVAAAASGGVQAYG